MADFSAFLTAPSSRSPFQNQSSIRVRDHSGGCILPVLLLLLLLLPAFLPGAAVAAGEVSEQEARLKQLRARIGELKTQLGSLRERKNSLDGELEKAERDIGSIAATQHRLGQEIAQSRARLEGLEAERHQQQQSLQHMRAELKRDLRSAYLMGRQERVKLLLNQQDPAMVERMLTYHGYFTRARSERMQKIHALLSRLDSVEQSLLAEQQRLGDLQVRQREKAEQLQQQQARRKQVLTGLQAELKKKSGQLTTLERDEQRLQKLVESLQAALRDIPPAAGQYKSLASLKGKLAWPVAGRIKISYGRQQAGGKLKSRGILIGADAGLEVRAIARGRVAYADWLRGFGLLLILDHGDGYMSLYGHNRSLYRDVGEWVGGGDVIAAVGDSGGQQNSGLYLEMRKNGRPFNPAPWFAGKPSARQAQR